MTEFNQALYDQRITDMKARERAQGLILMGLALRWDIRAQEQDDRNLDRLAAYKRKRQFHKMHANFIRAVAKHDT